MWPHCNHGSEVKRESGIGEDGMKHVSRNCFTIPKYLVIGYSKICFPLAASTTGYPHVLSHVNLFILTQNHQNYIDVV